MIYTAYIHWYIDVCKSTSFFIAVTFQKLTGNKKGFGGLWSNGLLSTSTWSNRRHTGETSKTMGINPSLQNSWLVRPRNRSLIKGLGKNPQKSELIHWRQCFLSRATEPCPLWLRETLACIHVIPHNVTPRVACWHGSRPNSQKMECVLRRPPIRGWKKKSGFIRHPMRTG